MFWRVQNSHDHGGTTREEVEEEQEEEEDTREEFATAGDRGTITEDEGAAAFAGRTLALGAEVGAVKIVSHCGH